MSKLKAITDSFDRLSGREQLLSLLMVFMILGMIVGLGGFIISSDLKKRERRINANLSQLQTLVEAREGYQKKLSEQRKLASQIKRNNKTRLLSYIEDISKRANTEIKNASERAGKPTGSDQIKEESAEVSVQNVSISRLHEFLKQIETGNSLIKVRKLEIKTRFDNPQRLDAKVTVGTFKSSES